MAKKAKTQYSSVLATSMSELCEKLNELKATLKKFKVVAVVYEPNPDARAVVTDGNQWYSYVALYTSATYAEDKHEISGRMT